MRIGSLFAGIGGFDLAAERVWGHGCTIWHSEIDPYACAVFAQHFPQSRNVGDITTWEPDLERDTVDLICGGFPCQPVSIAGKRLAQDDPRWLWPHCGRVIRILRPEFVLLENVPGLLVRGMGEVLGGLADLGYDAEWAVLQASWFGVPQNRNRVFIVAYPSRDDSTPLFHQDAFDALRHRPWMDGAGGETPDLNHEDYGTGTVSLLGDATRPEVPNGSRSGTDDGLPGRLDNARYKCLGNSIVPQVAEWVFRQIQAREERLAR